MNRKVHFAVNMFTDCVVQKNVVDGSSMIWFPHVIADSERGMPGIEPGPLGVHTSAQSRISSGRGYILLDNIQFVEQCFVKYTSKYYLSKIIPFQNVFSN